MTTPMTDLKTIEEIVREHFYPGPVAGSTARLAKALGDYVAALPQPTGESVAWRVRDYKGRWILTNRDEGADPVEGGCADDFVQPLYAHPPTTDVEALISERDYAVSELKNARAYWNIETRHAERAESERDIALTRATRAEAERDYAVSEMKNAKAYWRIETSHAEQAEAERDAYQAALKPALARADKAELALEEALMDLADVRRQSRAYLDEIDRLTAERDAAIARADRAERALRNIKIEYDREGSRPPHLSRVVAIQCRLGLAPTQAEEPRP